jgi:hypothetical protein
MARVRQHEQHRQASCVGSSLDLIHASEEKKIEFESVGYLHMGLGMQICIAALCLPAFLVGEMHCEEELERLLLACHYHEYQVWIGAPSHIPLVSLDVPGH